MMLDCCWNTRNANPEPFSSSALLTDVGLIWLTGPIRLHPVRKNGVGGGRGFVMMDRRT
jgi:hypothetical protein